MICFNPVYKGGALFWLTVIIANIADMVDSIIGVASFGLLCTNFGMSIRVIGIELKVRLAKTKEEKRG